MSSSTSNDRKTIVLIHGLFLNWSSWDKWVERYSAAGHDVMAPGWPGMSGTVDELRRDPTPLKHQSISSVVDYFEDLIGKLDAPPIIMGHSFGGLFAQLLAYRGLGEAVVAIDAVAPAGVLDLPFSTLKASAPVLANPLNIGEATMLTPKQFRYAFANTVSEETSQDLYDRYAIPCANRVLFEGSFENIVPNASTRIDAEADRPPLLLIAGGADHLVPPGYSRSNFKLVGKSPGLTAFKEFEGRPHFTGAVPGWEAVADYALTWALSPTAVESQSEIRPA